MCYSDRGGGGGGGQNQENENKQIISETKQNKPKTPSYVIDGSVLRVVK